jgi:predicted metal-dependent phosphoesterase TrpH
LIAKPIGPIDLHTHTTASDGTLTPEELVHAAASRGLSVIGITDHDTVEAVEPARVAGRRVGLRVVAGLELSARLDHRSVHLLAYGLDDLSPALKLALADRVERRAARAHLIVQRLKDQGIPVSWDSVARQTTGAIGRPHIARVLIEKGYAENVSDAFARWIGWDRPAYVPSPSFSPADAVALVRAAGGEVGLAHPLRGAKRLLLDTAVPALIAAGVTGLEVYYSDHSAEDVAMLGAIAGRYGLWWSGGSDFHGANKPWIEIGSVDVPSSVLAQGPFLAAIARAS